MIRCTVCQGRVRPPPRPWAAVDGGVHFYQTNSDMAAYAKVLATLAKKMAFVHEACAEAAEPGTLPQPHVVALNLDAKLRAQQQARGGH